MWNVQKYREVLKKAAKNEKFTNEYGEKIKTKEELYHYICNQFFLVCFIYQTTDV